MRGPLSETPKGPPRVILGARRRIFPVGSRVAPGLSLNFIYYMALLRGLGESKSAAKSSQGQLLYVVASPELALNRDLDNSGQHRYTGSTGFRNLRRLCLPIARPHPLLPESKLSEDRAMCRLQVPR
jgi:hypothetical protein